MKTAVRVALTLAAISFPILAQEKSPPSPPAGLSSVAGLPQVLPMNINRVLAWYNANGLQEYPSPLFNGGGMIYPRGTALAVFASGVLLGGKVRDGLQPVQRVSGQYFLSTMAPGAILGIRTGQRQNPADSSVRLYKIRRDFRRTDLRTDAADTYRKTTASVTNADIGRLRSSYAKDWAEWPWQFGAPFSDAGYLDRSRLLAGGNNGILDWGEDVNRNAFLDPGEDLNRNGLLDGETPGYADADMVLWFVCNDAGPQSFGGRTSGLEMQATIWAYNRTDALANVIYKRFRYIYKGTANTPATAFIDSMFIGQESDPDLGDPTDDYAGCDTLLGLGFVYNATPNDRLFVNSPPPAVGFDLVQGPMVRGATGQDRNRNGVDDASDFALRDLKIVGPGFINLPVTSFVYFDRHTRFGSRYAAPTFGQFGGIQWYQTLRGLPPTPTGPPDPPPLVSPTTLAATRYWASGDPVLGHGWLDGDPIFPGDREILLSSGPFSMALGDTQEVVFAVVGGIGTDHKSSVKAMKYNDRVAQVAYNGAFKNAKAAAQPNAKAVVLDGQILIEWGHDSASIANTENTVLFGNYRFEGYNVYQFPDGETDLKKAKRLATFDLVNTVRTISQEEFDVQAGEIYLRPAQYGTDSGIKRNMLVSRDSIWQQPLVNGQRYYFAVTAYTYTSDASSVVRTVENAPIILEAIPESSRPGVAHQYNVGDTVMVRSIVGNSDAVIVPTVYNPRAQTGAVFHLKFDTTASRALQWTLMNAATGRVAHRNITDLSGRIPFDVPEGGFSVTVGIPPVGLRYVLDKDGNDAYGPSNPNPNYTVLSYFRTLRSMNGVGTTQRDYEIRFDGRGSYAIRMIVLNSQSDAIKVPFSIWDIGRSSADAPVQVIPSFRDSANTPRTWNVTPNGVRYGDTLFKVFEPIFITDVPYPTSGSDSAGVLAQRTPVFRASQAREEQGNALFGIQIADKDNDGLPPPVGTVIRFIKFHEIRHGDVKEIIPLAPTIAAAKLQRSEIDRINVVPNPYYGEAVTPTRQVQRHVRFTHLPTTAYVRIFNLGGVLVRTLIKESEGQFLVWDLRNEFDLPVASGIYLAHIEMPDVKAVKVLKIVVIQGEENSSGF